MEFKNYPEFAAQCISDLKPIQDKFYEDYNVNSYANWFYDQATGLFTFSTGDEEINFYYIEVGSYSSKIGTWLWAWHNEGILEKARKTSLLIKNYGEDHEFEKLLNGYFDSNEFEGWEFAAIALKILGGIGVYRTKYENGLQKFVVLQKFVDNATAQAIKDKYVRCNTHGSARMAFVCRHLSTTTIKLGFEEAFETWRDMELYEDDDLQAWCNECEVVRKTAGEWNDETMKFADIKLVCEDCYFIMKNLHQT